MFSNRVALEIQQIFFFQQIFNLLKERSRFNIDRVSIGGSAGKKTAIFNSDLDCVVFVNVDTLSDIENVLDDFEDIFLLAQLPKLTRIWKTRFSIQFNYDDYDVDLLPAINFIKSSQLPPNSEICSEQAYEVLENIYNNKDLSYHYSSALVETQLSFMRKQSSFVHDLVRLCKLWNKSLLIDEYISGRSTLVELIAVYAGIAEEKRSCFDDRRSLLSAFNHFLKLIENFKQLKIEFDFDPLAPQRSINNFSWLKDNKEVKKYVPYVIEPSNPFNNLGKNVKEAQIKQLQMYAAETIRRLQGYVFMTAFTFIPLDVIFEPQPTVHRFITENVKAFLNSVSFMTSTSVNEGPSSATTTIRNNSKYRDRDMQVLLKNLQNVFSIVAQGLVSSEWFNQPKDGKQVRDKLQEKIETYIDVGIKGVEHRPWTSTTKKHEDQDITLSIPCYMMINNKQEKLCVYISWSSV